jgi:diphthamide synthase (EF-2-diphthine--ammonia ligase)
MVTASFPQNLIDVPDPGPTPAEAAMLRETALDHETQLNVVKSTLSEAEKAILERFCDGVRETSECAKALSLGHLPLKRQQREIKKIKDRLWKKLTRWLWNRD